MMLNNLKTRIGPDGLHLFNRYNGLNILLDEVKPPSSEWSKAPRQVSIALTNACNLRCPHCYAPKHPSVLDYDQLAQWLSELDAAGCLGVGFGGGEPTLYPEFVRICNFASSKTSLATTFTTNLHPITEQLIESIRGSIHFVRASMDGVNSTYEALRGKSFDVFCKKLNLLRSLAPFGINFVVNSQTLPDINEAAALAADFGADEFLVLPEHPTRSSKGIDHETMKDLRRWIKNYKGNLRLSISEADASGLPLCNPFVLERDLQSYAHIDASGIIRRTSFETHGAKIGTGGILGALNDLKQSKGVIQ